MSTGLCNNVGMHQAFFPRSAVWRPSAQLSYGAIPARYRHWLLDPSSLTQRLIGACPGRFRVELLTLGWMRPLPDECRRLALRRGQLALVRQVQLRCDERAWVYARTVIPRTTLSGRQRRLAYLGARPLGAALFADPTMQRDAVEVVRLVPGGRLFALAAQGLGLPPAELWGRRSVFRLAGKPLLVSEIFLPDIAQVPCR
jgi:chorismate--pyruvate lyase